MCVWRYVADPFEYRHGDVRCRYLIREVLTDEAGDLVLVFQGIAAGDHTPGAVTEQEHRPARLARLDDVDEGREIPGPIRELLDEEALALGAAAAAMIQRVDGEPVGRELLRGPFVQAAVRVQSVGDDDYGARPTRRLPFAREDLDALDAFEASFSHVLDPRCLGMGCRGQLRRTRSVCPERRPVHAPDIDCRLSPRRHASAGLCTPNPTRPWALSAAVPGAAHPRPEPFRSTAAACRRTR